MPLVLLDQTTLSHSDETTCILAKMDKIGTWTAEKYKIFDALKLTIFREGYEIFSIDSRRFGLQSIGQTKIFRVPEDQRGALKKFAGRAIRAICVGYTDPYSGREIAIKPIAEPDMRTSPI